ncbi:protein of unknown function [Shewanella benthica]|uniref:Uncharacterized protein n=1 Tax=Shewanella benthica TaxID=43661 RepID=A0A330MB88_9GAMM|nr:protein of unknown function [Shewanella benthica]
MVSCRDKVALIPEKSDYTSIQTRIKAALKGEQPKSLLPFIGNEKRHQPKGVNFELQD